MLVHRVGVAAGLGLAAATAGAAVAANWAVGSLAVLVLGCVCIALVRPRIVLTLLVASTFFSHIVLSAAGFNIRLEYLVLPLAAIALAVDGRRQHVTTGHASARQLLAIALSAWLVLNVTATLTHSVQIGRSLSIDAVYLLDVLVLLVVVRAFDGQRRQLIQVLVLTNAVSVAIGVIAYVQAATSGSSWGALTDTSYNTVVAYGLSWEPNILASTALLVFLLSWFAPECPALWRWISLGALIVAVLITATRAAVVAALILALASAPMLRKVRLSPERLLASMLGAALVGTWIASGALGDVVAKFSHLLDFNGGTGAYRTTTWRTALSDLTQHQGWLLGLGTNSYGQRHLDPTLPGTPGYLGNLPLQILYDTGVLGVVAGLGVLLLVIHGSGRFSYKRALAATSFIAISITTSPLFLGISWVLLGSALVSPASGGLPDGPAPKSPRLFRVLAGVHK